MEHAIKTFPTQFAWKPRIENARRLKKLDYFVVAGMGGSHLAAGLIRTWKPDIPLYIHQDYDLPPVPTEFLKKSLLIASSYSGNTEEVLDFFEQARKSGLPLAAISVGGKLLEQAVRYNIPYIQIPETGIQPRSALGFSFKALLKFMRQGAALTEVTKLSKRLNPSTFRASGKDLAKRLKDHIPVIYGSLHNLSIAYNWKIKFNETSKIPAFSNVLPELNHNEMTGFDVAPSTRKLSKLFHFILLNDPEDHPRIQRRMKVLKKLLEDRGLPVEAIRLHTNRGPFYKIFSSLLLADWASYFTAELYRVDPEQVPMVEEFKRLIAK